MTDLVFKCTKDTDFKEGQEYVHDHPQGQKRFVKTVRGKLALVDRRGRVCNENLENGSLAKYALVKGVEFTPFGQLSDEEKGALLLAHHNGEPIQSRDYIEGDWVTVSLPKWYTGVTYRVKPQPVVETVSFYMSANNSWRAYKLGKDTHKLSYDIVGGEIDCSSVKLEVIK